MKKHIVCFHLFNDYSGSPKVLDMVLRGLLKKGCTIDLITSRGGVLDTLPKSDGLRRYSYSYHFSVNPVVTMLRYTAIQLYTFFFALRYLTTKSTFYINTLLPAGPALAGRLMGKRVVYHYHENAAVKGTFYKLLASLMQILATEIICVSHYQASLLKRKKGVSVVPNALPQEFAAELKPDPKAAFNRKTVLMLSSLKEYKGTREFIELAASLPQYKFVLVINDNRENIDNYLKNNGLPPHCCRLNNLTVYSQTRQVSQFYNSASMALCLTNSKQAIETFGLTTLEAMTAGLPVIVPTEGGVAEMVVDGENGYKTDVADIDKIKKQITIVLTNKTMYLRMSKSATDKAQCYGEQAVVDSIQRHL